MNEHEKEQLEFDKWLIDAAREANFMYWAALLTANATLLSVFSAIFVFSRHDRLLIILIVLSSLISCALLILNFKRFLDFERYRGVVRISKEDTLTKEQMQTNGAEWGATGNAIKNRERIVTGLLFLQAVLILVSLLKSMAESC